MSAQPSLVLASASPRRLELLRRIGVVPDAVDPADIDESVRPGERPMPHVARLAAEKAAVVAARHPGKLVLAADTLVAVGLRILPKAEDEATARACLRLLSGRRHQVLTAVTVVTTAHHTRLLTAQREQLVLERDALDIEWRNLILEENALGDHSRVERIATEKLQMQHVDPSQENIVVQK